MLNTHEWGTPMNATQAYEAAQAMIEQGGTEVILDELLRAFPTDQLAEVLRFIATNWDYDVPELFEDEDEEEDEEGQIMYVVHFTGEYDLDENGGVIPLIKSYKNKEAAFAAAQEWERNTGYIANIEQIE